MFTVKDGREVEAPRSAFRLCILFTSTIGRSEDGRATEEGWSRCRY